MIGYQPALPLSGYTGWKYLQRTMESQQEVFQKSPVLERELEHFSKNIRAADTAQKLVADRQLLKVALGAFGLEGDLDKKAYVLKVLEEGTEDPKAFANRMVDKRYKAFATAFGYGNQFGANVWQSDFAQKITEQYKSRQFEVAIGDVDENMRLAMTFKREMQNIAQTQNSRSAWFQILGNPPMRSVIESAFGLPKSFGGLDVDKQNEILQDFAQRKLGVKEVSDFQDPDKVEDVLRKFFIRKQIEEGPSANIRGSTALSLLSSVSAGMSSLLQSRF